MPCGPHFEFKLIPSSRFTYLASSAALEFDRRRIDGSEIIDKKGLKMLATILSSVAEKDIREMAILHDAYKRLQPQYKLPDVRTTPELISATSPLVDLLRHPDERSVPDIEKARDFCLSLCGAARAYESRYYHPSLTRPLSGPLEPFGSSKFLTGVR